MKLETFFEKFDLFADAPDAVAKMRELVLELAVQGRLVSQSPNDEPAHTLAATIAGDRVAFVKKRNLTRQRVFPAVEEEQCPFALPAGWAWTRLGNLCRVQAGFAFESAAFVQGDSGVPMIRIRDITKDHTQVNYVGEYREEFLVDVGDYLVGMDGNFTVAKWRGPQALLNQRVSRLQWYSRHLEPSFFAVALQHRLLELQGTKAYTTVDHLSSGQIENAVVPLPPLAEQKRIVEKVDELMALCDRLAAQQQIRETRHAALARASLARFADAPTPANLPLLFHGSFPIPPSDLRKAILTLAVQGKLVPQDPNDESVEELATELARLKTQLLAGRRIRNQKVSGCPSEEDFPFEIPASWKWVRLGHAVTLLGGYAYESGAYVPTSSNQIIRLGNVKSDALLLDQKPAFIPDSLAEQTTEYAILEGDILVTMTGTKAKRDYAFTLAVKRAELGGRRLFLNQRVGAIRPFQRELVPLINIFLKSDQLLDLVFATATGTANQANIGTSSILDLPFPLPPLAEQRRIVAKVDELMALVDALETQLPTARTTATALLAAAVDELTTQN